MLAKRSRVKLQYVPAPPAATGGGSSGSSFRSRAWLAATRKSKEMLLAHLRQHARPSGNELFLFTDLDVLPLRSYDALVAAFLAAERASPRPPEILFLREPDGHCGMTPWPANTGLVLMRNTKRVRDFWQWTTISARGKVYEQDVANFLLMRKLKAHELSWGLLPAELAAASLDRVGPQTVAFHAIGASGGDKFALLEAAWQRAGLAGSLACQNATRVSVPSSWRGAASVPTTVECLS